MTECSELRFAFATEGRREIVAEFNGGAISSDGGALLLRETDRKLKLLERFSQCFLDGRNQGLVEHRIEQMPVLDAGGRLVGMITRQAAETLTSDSTTQ